MTIIAGGLYHFRNQILRGNPDLIFVVNSDVCCAFPFQEMLQFHRKHEGICTILGTHVPKEIATRYGCLVAKDGTGEVLHYVEKPETFVSDLISCGVYLFSPEIFKDIKVLMEPSSGSDFIDSEVIRLEQDVLQPLAGTGRLFVFETTEFWRQIKTAGSAVPANTLYLYQYAKTGSSMLAVPQKDGPTIVGNVYIHPTAHVHPSAKLGPNVSIGPRVTIGKGVRVKESIILDNVEVKVLYTACK